MALRTVTAAAPGDLSLSRESHVVADPRSRRERQRIQFSSL